MTPPLPFERRPWWQRLLLPFALLISLGAHGAFAAINIHRQALQQAEEVWIEMEVTKPEPPPEQPPPPPEPEPEPPPKPPEPVKFEDTVVEAPPEEVKPVEERKVVKMQGLSSSSFAQGSGTGLSVRAGTTVAAKATQDTMAIGEAEESVAYAAATTQPKLRFRPAFTAPEAVIASGGEGFMRVVIDIDDKGKVTSVQLQSSDLVSCDPTCEQAFLESCIESWKKARFKPGMQGDTPVPIRGMPQRCVVKAIE